MSIFRPMRVSRSQILLVVAGLVASALPVVVPSAVPTAASSVLPVVARMAPSVASGSSDPAVRIAALTGAASRSSARSATATARLDRVAADLAAAQQREGAARARTDELSVAAAEAGARYEASRNRLRALAVSAYRDGPRVGVLDRLAHSESFAEFIYRRELIERVEEYQHRTIVAARRDRIAAREAAERARVERERLQGLVESLTASRNEADGAAAAARAEAQGDQYWLARWQTISGGVDTSIRGAPQLTGEELARWYSASRRRYRATVPVQELTQQYVEEGIAAGVRSDIAFAQSILETGGFWFPDGGLVLATDNNFAGIGACDSCAHGRSYPDARTGIRAQMQLLRVYADPYLTNASLNPPPVDPKLDTHFLKGDVRTWGGLTGTWATASAYGDRVLSIYGQILGWLTDHRA